MKKAKVGQIGKQARGTSADWKGTTFFDNILKEGSRLRSKRMVKKGNKDNNEVLVK